MGILDWLSDRGSRGTSELITGKFGRDRHQPPGDWVQTTVVEKVAGLQHRLDDVLTFCAVVQNAELVGKFYGVELRPEPNNPHDANAIAVDGVAGNRRWHIGYLDRATAKQMHEDLLSKNIPITAELYSIWAGDDGYIDVNVIVLAPPGHGHKARLNQERGKE